jgi:hypothetical protein
VGDDWREVSRDEFFEVINKLDVHPTPIGRYPYTSLFKMRDGRVVAKIVDTLPERSAMPVSSYWLRSR